MITENQYSIKIVTIVTIIITMLQQQLQQYIITEYNNNVITKIEHYTLTKYGQNNHDNINIIKTVVTILII